MLRRWLAPILLGILVFAGLTRMSLLTLCGLALLIGVGDAVWLNRARTDFPGRMLRRWAIPAVGLAILLLILALLFPYHL